jgi:hypothetical protein
MDFQQARTKVGAGWHQILNNLFRARPAGCVITDVSRVDGRLHIAGTGITAMFRGNIIAAEHDSAKTCEHCGNNGGHRREMDGGEIATLCDACEVLRKMRRF